MFSGHSRDYKRDHKHRFPNSTKEKKLSKLIASDSDTEGESEHELSHYIDDRVKLMKEVLKIIKPKKIKSMAPDCMKNMDLQEINSMLLEELLGISNKRLRYIFAGKNLDEESSTDEDQPIDVISLDDISDDDFVVISDDETDKQKHKHKKKKIKKEPEERSKKVKKEKPDKDRTKGKEKSDTKEKGIIGEENLMSVLELLELQARARAIRSQLELENKKKQDELQQHRAENKVLEKSQDEDDEVIIEVPKEVEIVITSSDSENEVGKVGSSHTKHSSKTYSENVNKHINDVDDNGNEDVLVGKPEFTNKTVDISIEKDKKDAEDCSTSKLDSDSSSNDNLQVISEREKRRKRHGDTNKSKDKNVEQGEPSVGDVCHDEDIGPESQTLETSQDNASTSGSSRIEAAIEKFMETQPTAVKNVEELKKVDKEHQEKTEKIKKDKEKRLKHLKNKLHSFKQDVAVESSSVTVLENIVIKPKSLELCKSRDSKKHVEDADDLVINVDQDDVDCMVCD